MISRAARRTAQLALELARGSQNPWPAPLLFCLQNFLEIYSIVVIETAPTALIYSNRARTITFSHPPCATAKRLLGAEDPEQMLKEVEGYYKILNATRAVNLSVADEGGSVRPGALADFIKNNPASPTGAPTGAPTPAPTPTGHGADFIADMKMSSRPDSPMTPTAEELFQTFMRRPASPNGMTMSSAGSRGATESQGEGPLGVELEASIDGHDFDGELDERRRHQNATDWVASALPPPPASHE